MIWCALIIPPSQLSNVVHFDEHDVIDVMFVTHHTALSRADPQGDLI